MGKKVGNIAKQIEKAAKDTNKAVVKPIAKTTVQAATATNQAVIQPTVTATNQAVIQPAIKVAAPAVAATNQAVIQPAVKVAAPVVAATNQEVIQPTVKVAAPVVAATNQEVIQPTVKVAAPVVAATNQEVIQPTVKVAVPSVAPAVTATNKAVVQPAVKVAAPSVAPAVTATNKPVIQPAVKGSSAEKKKKNKKKTGVLKPTEKKSLSNIAVLDSKYKEQVNECNTKLKTMTTELTNLKYTIDTLDKENQKNINEISKKNTEITELNNKVGSLNKTVNTLDNRINAPLVTKEGFSGFSGFSGYATMFEGFGPENPRPVTRDMSYNDYDLTKSGLASAARTYKQLYGNYYAGYQDNETMIKDVLNPQVAYLSATDLDGMQYSYVAVQQQNKTLESQIEDTAEEYSTDFQRSKYAEEELTSVKKRNAVLFFGFYILFFIFAYVLFTESDISVFTKIGVLVFLFVYPYLIGYISNTTMFIYKSIVALFRGVPM